MYNINDLVIDERIKKVFWFMSKVRILGMFWVMFCFIFSPLNMLLSRTTFDSIIEVISFILLGLVGIVIFIRPTKKIFLSSIIIYIILIIRNIIIMPKNMVLALVFPAIIIVACLRIYHKVKSLEITKDDRNTFRQILKSFSSFNSHNNMIKIKIYNIVKSRIWKCIIIDNVVIITSRYKIELYIANKKDFEILKAKENIITQSYKGKLIINEEIQKFIMKNKEFKALKLMLME